ncbi:hypothetical protein BJX64DRAFT_291072 [Aspergillus heterothallicus]
MVVTAPNNSHNQPRLSQAAYYHRYPNYHSISHGTGTGRFGGMSNAEIQAIFDRDKYDYYSTQPSQDPYSYNTSPPQADPYYYYNNPHYYNNLNVKCNRSSYEQPSYMTQPSNPTIEELMSRPIINQAPMVLNTIRPRRLNTMDEDDDDAGVDPYEADGVGDKRGSRTEDEAEGDLAGVASPE